MATEPPLSHEKLLALLRWKYDHIHAEYRYNIFPTFAGIMPYKSVAEMHRDLDSLRAICDLKLSDLYKQVSDVLKGTQYPQEMSAEDIGRDFYCEQEAKNKKLFKMMLKDAEEWLDRDVAMLKPVEMPKRNMFLDGPMDYAKSVSRCPKPEASDRREKAEQLIKGDFRRETPDSKSLLSDAEVERLLYIKSLAGEVATEMELATEGKDGHEALREEWRGGRKRIGRRGRRTAGTKRWSRRWRARSSVVVSADLIELECCHACKLELVHRDWDCVRHRQAQV